MTPWSRCKGALATLALGGAVAAAHAEVPDAEALLLRLCDRLLSVQITDPADPDCGALVCPSTNPEVHPRHSRAAEAVYPLAVAYSRTGRVDLRRAAILLGDWLVSIQQPGGAWGESWPGHDGWVGTTADQLISLAGAYPLLASALEDPQRRAWLGSIASAAAFVEQRFPIGNINYWSTGAVGLHLASRVVPDAPEAWRMKAESMIAATLAAVNSDGLIVGESGGVDVGYNLAQTIGFLAMYGRLTGDEPLLKRVTEILTSHLPFVYPNGAIDNSWGSRSYKWTYESGTKTAPGVFFAFDLLADRDERFRAASRQAREFLVQHSLVDGWVAQGPHAERRATTNPPCLYGTFARAQSLAMALRLEPSAKRAPTEPEATPAASWQCHVFPTVKVVTVRTPQLAATVSAYGEPGRHRAWGFRGGSVSNVWWDGWGRDGFFQTASMNRYARLELKHMPIEEPLLPLTPRIEARVGNRRLSNLYEHGATIEAEQGGEEVTVTVDGELRDENGDAGGITYRLVQRFLAGRMEKSLTVTANGSITLEVFEPVVTPEGFSAERVGADRIIYRARDSAPRTLRVSSAGARFTLSHGENAAAYWAPFPAVEAYPVVIRTALEQAGDIHLHLAYEAPPRI